MSLLHELTYLLVSYLQHRIALDDVRLWLAERARELDASEDAGLRELAGHTWILLAELDRGDRNEDGVRRELDELIGSVQAASMIIVETFSTSGYFRVGRGDPGPTGVPTPGHSAPRARLSLGRLAGAH